MVGIGGSAWQWVALLGIITTMAKETVHMPHMQFHHAGDHCYTNYHDHVHGHGRRVLRPQEIFHIPCYHHCE